MSPGPGAPWAILQHADHEGPGTLTDALGRAGLAASVVRPDRGEDLPPAGAIGGLVVLGGPMGVHDPGLGWLAAERALLDEAVDAGLPVLAICLGAQQLALALGATVEPARSPEAGLGHVVLTRAGRLDPVLGGEHQGLGTTEVPCVHWHADTFTVPEGAVHLAATPAAPNQAFRVGRTVYAFQFHVEVDRGLAAAWRPLLPAGTALDDGRLASVTASGRRILDRFLQVATDPARSRGR